MSPTAAELVSILAEIEAIKELKASYFRLLDARDWVPYRQVFADDLQFFSGTETKPSITSGDDYVGWAKRMYPPGGPKTIHHGHNPEIEITGPRAAKGVWALSARTENPDGTVVTGAASSHYHEQYEKGTDGRWRIKQIRLRSNQNGPLPPVGAPRAEASGASVGSLPHSDGDSLPSSKAERVRVPRPVREGQDGVLARLWNQEQIAQLKARYCRFLDDKDWPNYRTCFTDDFTMALADGKPLVTSGDGYIEMAKRVFATALGTHHVHNPRIEFTGPRSATGAWPFLEIIDPREGPNKAMRGYGSYVEEYEKDTDGHWRIKRLTIRPATEAHPPPS